MAARVVALVAVFFLNAGAFVFGAAQAQDLLNPQSWGKMPSWLPAQNRTFFLEIVNDQPVPMVMEILPKERFCYEPHPEGEGGTEVTIEPQESYGWVVNRRQGHGCDGRNGEFTLRFLPVDKRLRNVGSRVCFSYTNTRALFLGRTVHVSCDGGNFGRLMRVDDHHYQYFIVGDYKVPTASVEYGYWKQICKDGCTANAILRRGEMNRNEEIATADALLAKGVRLQRYQLESQADFDEMMATGRAMSEQILKSHRQGTVPTLPYSNEDMGQLGIGTVWQWMAHVRVRDHHERSYETPSDFLACMRDDLEPVIYPTDPEVERSCLAGFVGWDTWSDVLCTEQGEYGSWQGKSAPLKVTFSNKLPQPRRLVWLDFDGKQVNPTTLRPRETRVVDAYSGYRWMTLDTDGNCLEIFEAKSDETDFTFFR